MNPAIIISAIVALISGFVIFKNIPINQPQPTPDKGFQATMNALTNEASPSATITPNISPKKSPTPKPSVKPSSSPKASNSNNSSSSSTGSSGNSNSSSGSSASTAPSTSPTPTPTPAPQTCDGLCFDRNSASVEITQGSGVESGGSTAQAFNLIGDGTRGYQLNSTGLPDGISIWPSSGGFGESTFPVKIWITNNGNVSAGTYTGTITLKKGPSYSEVGTMSITVTYKKP